MKAMGLKSNELRIGNYVNHSDFNTPVMVSGLILEDSRPRVAIINGSTTFLVGGDWSAIPLTEEWLIKLPIDLIYPIWIKYLHELQNWYYWNNEKKELTIKE
jgi:hypothetical protein